jgi:hypothetical protein
LRSGSASPGREQQIERGRRRELRRTAEPAVLGIGALEQAQRALRGGSAPGTAEPARGRRASASVISAALRVTSSRRSRHACATPASTWRNAGMPWRGSGG